MKYQQIKFKEIAEFRNGLNFDKTAYSDCGIKYIGVADFGSLMFPDFSNLGKIKETVVRKEYLLKKGDLLFVRSNGNKNLVGRSLLIKKLPEEPVTFSGFCIQARVDPAVADSKYLLYYTHSTIFRKMLAGNSVGANIQNLSQDRLGDCTVSLPSIDNQRKIASYLSVYDDLIENNQKKIRLLEESCQLYYATFHFEEYSNDTLFDFDCCIESGRRPVGGIDSSIKEGVPSIGAENVIGLGKYNFNTKKYISSEFYEKMKTGKIKNKDILVYKDGAYIGKVSLFQDGFPYNKAAVNEHVFLLHAKDDVYQYYLFFTLSQKQYYMKMQNLNSNAAQPGLNQRTLLSLELPLPPVEVIRKFNDYVVPIVSEIFKLAKQNKLLTEQRDLLMNRIFNDNNEVKL